ncbi:hypothetical protein OIU77_015971 [Salix suchowensis]|uniref:Protein BZR1 homolog n=1 Tax=Salix suchowensis TaxID=1278906 RepID=A0ABQ8ZIW3_9ROSI|nr:hypothetical protein OIU77_015971 [Salix suchowensis]
MAGYCTASQYVPPHNAGVRVIRREQKLRERQRRAITTRIFHGLRKFGGYHLSRRSDINQVLRELAKEAGWVVEPDGTTYRYKVVSRCPTCGVIPNTSTNTTPTTSSTVIACGGGGDCSPTTSPLCNIGPHSCTGDVDNSNPLAFYMYNGPASGLHHPSTAALAGGGMKVQIPSQRQLQGTYIQEAMASNQKTPVGSPSHLQRTN